MLSHLKLESLQDLFTILTLSDGAQAYQTILSQKRSLFSLIPQSKLLDNFDQQSKYHDRDLLNHSLSVMSLVPPEFPLRFAALFHDIGKPLVAHRGKDDGCLHYKGHQSKSAEIVSGICNNLNFSSPDTEEILFYVHYHDSRPSSSVKSVRRFMKKCGNDKHIEENMISLFKADIISHAPEAAKSLDKKLDQAIEIYEIECDKRDSFKRTDLVINGHDLIKSGFQNQEIGTRLNQIFSLVDSGVLPNNREELIKYCSKDYVFVQSYTKHDGAVVREHFRLQNRQR